MHSEIYTVGPSEGSAHTHTIILLHGRDSYACEFADEFFESEVSQGDDCEPTTDRQIQHVFPTVRWVFPQAPTLKAARFGCDMPQWFDVWSVDECDESEAPEKAAHIQIPGLRDSVAALQKIVADETRLVAGPERVVLAGLSQGFATAVHALLAPWGGGEHLNVGGVVGWCSWLPLISQVEKMIESPNNVSSSLRRIYRRDDADCGSATAFVSRDLLLTTAATPLLLGHSADDPVVPVAMGRRMRDVLHRLDFHVEWHEYPDGGHWISEPAGIDHFARFLKEDVGVPCSHSAHMSSLIA